MATAGGESGPAAPVGPCRRRPTHLTLLSPFRGHNQPEKVEFIAANHIFQPSPPLSMGLGKSSPKPLNRLHSAAQFFFNLQSKSCHQLQVLSLSVFTTASNGRFSLFLCLNQSRINAMWNKLKQAVCGAGMVLGGVFCVVLELSLGAICLLLSLPLKGTLC